MNPFDASHEGRRLYLMRHGRTYDPRRDAPVVTREDDAALPLTSEGRSEVETTARAMARLPLDAVFSSTFRRSVETARIMADPHRLEVAER